MTDNTSLSLSLAFNKQLSINLLPVFENLMPTQSIEKYVNDNLSKTRDKVYTPIRTAFSMIFTGVQEDKSLQNTVNIFNEKYEFECKKLEQIESALLLQTKEADSKKVKKSGRPRKYKLKLPKSKNRELSSSTVAYTNARKRLPIDLLALIFEQSNNLGDIKEEDWHGYRTYITDGTYLQLQDTLKIREQYPPIENDGMFPQALLQVFIRQCPLSKLMDSIPLYLLSNSSAISMTISLSCSPSITFHNNIKSY